MSEKTIHVIPSEVLSCADSIRLLYDLKLYNRDTMNGLISHCKGQFQAGIFTIDSATDMSNNSFKRLITTYSNFLEYAGNYYKDRDEEIAEGVAKA